MSYLYSTRQRGTDTQGHGFEKKTIEEKLSDFERKGNHWLELMRNWIIEANQAENLSNKKILTDERFSCFHRLEPPRSGGNTFGGFQNALAGLGGNISPSRALFARRGQFFFKFVMVELRGLEPLTSCMPCKRSSQLSYSPAPDALMFHLMKGNYCSTFGVCTSVRGRPP